METTFGTYKNKRKNVNRKPKGDRPWFIYECKFARKNYRKLKRKFKKERTETLKQKVTEAEKHYKNTLDKNSKNYREKMKKELNNLKTSDPKEYWKILNRSREKKQADIPMEDLFNFFEKFKHYARFANSGEEHFNQEPLNNGNFERLNEGINTFISQEEIICSFPP